MDIKAIKILQMFFLTFWYLVLLCTNIALSIQNSYLKIHTTPYSSKIEKKL